MKRLVAVCLVLATSIGLPIGVAAEPGVVFNFSTNTGFVPVSSVQFLLGLSNGQVKKYAKGVSFPVLLWSTKKLVCDDGTVTNLSYGEGFDVVPSLIQSRGQLVGFQLSGLIENHFIADPFPVEELCSGSGTLDPSTTVTRTLMTGFGEESFILLQEAEVVGD
jgi:hypothetical protein